MALKTDVEHMLKQDQARISKLEEQVLNPVKDEVMIKTVLEQGGKLASLK